ncbi:hypothetical protein FNJ47_28015 [Bradyrhizobium sp. UFLA 03-164]|uniref:Uncharacterized protein n=1 Tax=Bradyrhizobium uaiense TaxID=2594946 RepID=A0A6P1BN09_9BRAD|nr:hypothetical protein [Bradyrhizobium uaiense]
MAIRKFAVMPRLERGIQYAAAYPLNSDASGILGRPVPSTPRLRRGHECMARRSFSGGGEPGDDIVVRGGRAPTSPSGSHPLRAARTRRHRPCSDRGSRRTAGCCRCRR